MESIRNWAFSLCVSTIIGSVLNIILPECQIQKTFKIVSCIFFMCAVISPLKDIDLSAANRYFEHEYKNNEYKTTEFSDISSEYIEKQIIDSTKKLLNDEGISAKEILVKINISENGSIDINKFVLNFGYLENPSEIAEKIHKKTGIKPEIILLGEN